VESSARCGFTFRSWNQGELFTQEEVLGSQCAARPGNEYEEVDEIARYEPQRREALCQRSKDGAGHERPALHVTRRYAPADWRLDEILKISAARNNPSSVPPEMQVSFDCREFAINSELT
jgi:hypothetical protein